jgi:hypothetical protein
LRDTAPRKLSGEGAAPAGGRSTRREAAELHNVPERKVRAAIGLERDDPDLAEQVLTGELTLNQAKRQLKGGGPRKQGDARHDDGPAPEGAGAAGVREAEGPVGQTAVGPEALGEILGRVNSLLSDSAENFERLAPDLSEESRAGLATQVGQIRSRVDWLARVLAGGRRPR